MDLLFCNLLKLTYSHRFFVYSIRFFFRRQLMLFTSSFPIWMLCISFSKLLNWLESKVQLWLELVRVDLALFLILGGKHLVFHYYEVNHNFRICLTKLNESHPVLACWEFLLGMDIWFCQMLFLHMLRWSFGFSFF